MDDLNTDLINFSSPVEEDEWKLHIHYNLIRITEMKRISRQKFPILIRLREQKVFFTLSFSFWASIKTAFQRKSKKRLFISRQ